MKESVRQQVFNYLDQGKTRDEIYEIFKDKNKETIATYISTFYKKNDNKKNDKFKNVFIDLERGLSDYDICCKYNICSATLDGTYKPTYRKTFNLSGQRNLVFSQLNYAHQYYNEEKQDILPTNSTLVKDEYHKVENCVPLFIGSNVYDIPFYIIDNIVWLDFLKLIDALNSENIKYDKNQITVNERYFSVMHINGQRVTIIDKNILLDFANQIGDHTFINSIIDLVVTQKNIFYKIQYVINGINMMADLVKELVEVGNSKLKVFEKLELDVLHYIEKNELSDDELLEQAKEIKNIRSKRRDFKNIYVLSSKIKYILSSHSCHSEALREIAKRLDPISRDLYNKIYNNRSELTEEEKLELLQ